jgi:hypothetical protein
VTAHTDLNKDSSMEENQEELQRNLDQIRKKMSKEEEGNINLIDKEDREENFEPLSKVMQQAKEVKKNEAKKKKAEVSKQNVSVVQFSRARSLQRQSNINTPRSRTTSRASSTSSTDGGDDQEKKTGVSM